MIVTIDGPAGSGKSSVARSLAERLGFQFLDTGATYRAVALAALRHGLKEADTDQLVRLATESRIELKGERVLLDGEDVSDEIRTSKVTSVIYYAADNPKVREALVLLQRQLAGENNVVTEGRDQGTVVFPDAFCKIFLTASPEERARRRLADLQRSGEKTTLEKVLADQTRRDERDTNRTAGPLVPALDAIQVNTDGFTLEEVVEQLEKIVRAKHLREST